MTTAQRIAAIWINRKMDAEEKCLRDWIGKEFLMRIGRVTHEYVGVRVERHYTGDFAPRCMLVAQSDGHGEFDFCVDDLQNGWREENHIAVYWDELEPTCREDSLGMALLWGVTREQHA